MKCLRCKKKFQSLERVIPVQRYIVNEKRGDFVGNVYEGEYIHLFCVPEVA